jgi:molecular chaperone DnaK
MEVALETLTQDYLDPHMSNWFLALKQFWQGLSRPFLRFFKRKTPYQQLVITCAALEQQLNTAKNQDHHWSTYTKALSLARQCNSQELTQFVLNFDSRLGEGSNGQFSLGLELGKAISFLLEAQPQTTETLDAAWRLCQRLEQPESRHPVQDQICLQLAQIGDGSALLSKLCKRQSENRLTPADLNPILTRFLAQHQFQPADPWQPFLAQFQPKDLPQMPEIYAVLERYQDAADLAEAAKDYRAALRYLAPLSGQTIALRTLELAQRLGEEQAITAANRQVATEFWQAGDAAQALDYFQKVGDLERVSDCHQKIGDLGLAIQARPTLPPDWILEIRKASETLARQDLERQNFLAAVKQLASVAAAWQAKSQTAEAERCQRLLTEAVRMARTAFQAEQQTCEPLAVNALYKRWSLLEEAAGNYLEAGLKAEQAQDYFSAALLFEQAGAFGQALVALETANPQVVDLQKKAQLLEQGGDFFPAALLHERLEDQEQAMRLYEKAGEFLRAAELCQIQLPPEQVLFDSRYQDLLAKAGRVEQLAELCASQAATVESPEQKARLWRRIKDLADQKLVADKWAILVAQELPELEVWDRAGFETQAPTWVKQATQHVLSEYSDAIGLDLGTSNSVVCLFNKQLKQPEVVEQQRRRQIPSVFAIDQTGRELVGVPIPELLGKSRRFRAGGQDYRAEEISARIISHARQFASAYLQKKIAAQVTTLATQATGSTPATDWVNEFLDQYPPEIPLRNIVITVPAYFNEAQKQATKTAGMLADIQVLRLIHEPTAACLAQRIKDQKSERILVADLGAGTFDLSVIEAGDGVFEVQEIEGDNTLGGADLDEIIYNHFSQFVQSETGQEMARNSQAATRLRQACEELKIELSSQPEWTIDLPYLVGDRSIQLSLTRAELEGLAADWLERIRQACQRVKQKPSRVLLIGGGGLMPAVQRCLKEVFQRTPDSAYDPITVVARGAALEAAILLKDIQDILLLDVTPFSLGIKCQDAAGVFRFDAIIPKHSSTPVDRTGRYTTVNDDQTQVVIEVFQGESPVPTENFKIGEFILGGIPIAKAGVPKIDVKFSIDANCLLTVTATDSATGNRQSITIADSHLLTPAQAASLKTRFQDAQVYQIALSHLEKLAAEFRTILQTVDYTDIQELSNRFQNRLQTYEQHRDHYLLTTTDNQILLEIYRDRSQLMDTTQLALDQWSTLSRSVGLWLDRYSLLNWRAADIKEQVQPLLEEGEPLLQRAESAKMDILDIGANYQRWLSVIESLTINPKGAPQALAVHFLRLQRYPEAQSQFQRLAPPLAIDQIELGLEILGRGRQRQAYMDLLQEHATVLGLNRPDFENLNQAVRTYTDSVVWIQVDVAPGSASGSGFVISPNQIATNRHVLLNDATGDYVAPQAIRIVTQTGSLSVAAIHLPKGSTDDIAILELEPNSTPLTPLRLGFSELVEIGEKIITLGFPAPEPGGFIENLYCNTGLVNRIRLSQLCSERVLEVSISLRDGISGAPILNQLGEVIGVLTFSTEKTIESAGGSAHREQAFYAIPIEPLRRLRANVSG